MLSHTAAPAVAAFLTPRLADRLSWQNVCFLYAGAGAVFGTLWQLGASSKPTTAAEPAPAATPAAKAEPRTKTKVPWRMFRLPCVRALMAYHIAYDNMKWVQKRSTVGLGR